MYGRCKPTLISPVGVPAETELEKNVTCVYQELSINFQYESEAGLHERAEQRLLGGEHHG